MKNPSFWLLAALVAAPLPVLAQSQAGQFDSYTFTMSWEPAFCEGKPSATECQTESPSRFDASNLALHGLWPDVNGDSAHAYGYCGVDASEQKLDRAPTWCQLPEPPYSDATRAALTTVMPGVASCLDHHEWSKHGSCSGMAADDYFALAAALVQRVAATAFGQYLTAHAGQTVDESALVSAYEADFGAGTGGNLVMNCTNIRGSSALLEVRVHLPNPPPAASALTTSVISTGDRGNCPSSFLLDPVPSR